MLARIRQSVFREWIDESLLLRLKRIGLVALVMIASAATVLVSALVCIGWQRHLYLSRVSTIRVGMTDSQVEQILGPPIDLRTPDHKFFYTRLSCVPCNSAASQWRYVSPYGLMPGVDLFCFDANGVLVGIYHT